MKGRVIAASVPELRILGLKNQPFGIAETRGRQIGSDRCRSCDEIRLLFQTRRVGLVEDLVCRWPVIQIPRADVYEQAAGRVTSRQLLIEKVKLAAEVRAGKFAAEVTLVVLAGIWALSVIGHGGGVLVGSSC